MSVETDLKHLKALLDSRGWAILKEVMDREIVNAAMAIANSATMTVDEINFRRGSIWAAKQLLDLPNRVISIKQAEAALSPKDDKLPADKS